MASSFPFNAQEDMETNTFCSLMLELITSIVSEENT